MDWVKRNLYFLIGGTVSLVLMGLAGYYLYSKWQLNGEIREKLNAEYAELQRLNRENPHPGDKKVNNVQAAKDQQDQVRQFITSARPFFKAIPPVPEGEKVTSQEYAAALRRTIDQLQKRATNSSVILSPNYSFSFEAQKQKVTFAPGSLEPLARQLGEIKEICSILFDAKINSLDSIRRERVSQDDSTGPQTDYIEKKTVTNELALLTPYEINIRTFSPELGQVLAGLASSPYGFVVKSINVDPAAASGPTVDPTAPGMYTPAPAQYIPAPVPAAEAEGGTASAAAMFARRYGLPGAEGGKPGMGGVPLRPITPGATPPAYTPPTTYGTQPAAPRNVVPQTVLDEKQLRVTIMLDIVKLLPPK